MRPDGLIELPNGSHIFYDDASHAYYRARLDGQKFVRSTRLTGCSTLCKPYNFNADRLLSWKERMTCEGIAALVEADVAANAAVQHIEGWCPPDHEWLLSSGTIRDRLRLEGVTADDARDRKATLGTNIHSVLEALAGIGDWPDLNAMPPEEQLYAKAVMSWWETRRPQVLQAEQFVYSEAYGFAGRFDLRANLKYEGPEGESTWPCALVDLKTSSFIAPSMHVQLALYELGAKECGIGSTVFQLVLQVKPDGTWREVLSKASEKDALSAIDVYRGAARIEREAKAA